MVQYCEKISIGYFKHRSLQDAAPSIVFSSDEIQLFYKVMVDALWALGTEEGFYPDPWGYTPSFQMGDSS